MRERVRHAPKARKVNLRNQIKVVFCRGSRQLLEEERRRKQQIRLVDFSCWRRIGGRSDVERRRSKKEKEKGFRRVASKTIFNALGIENAAYAVHVPTGARKTHFVC